MNQKGAVPPLVLVALVGVIAFIVLTSSAPFKDDLLNNLFPKPSSDAATKVPSTATSAQGSHKMDPEDMTPITSDHPAGYAGGWHTPTTHEHGDKPPQWVVDSQWQPFTQTRESHQGYKGVYVKNDKGVESYLIAHIISRAGARSHGDHDYQLWIKEPNNGPVSYWGRGPVETSVLDFGLSPTQQRCFKSALRPSMEEANNTEAWYMNGNSSGLVINVAWLMYGPNQPFCPGNAGGDGSARDIGFFVNADLFPGPDAQSVSPTLKNYCVREDSTDGKGCLIKFKRGYFDYATRPMALPN